MRRIVPILILLAACNTTDPGLVKERRPGVIAYFGDTASVDLATEATVGTPSTVTVRTFGGGCTSKGDTQAAVTGLTADITPYDSEVTRLPSNMACPDNLAFLPHTVELTFATPGTATIRIHGRAEPEKTPVELTRTIAVH